MMKPNYRPFSKAFLMPALMAFLFISYSCSESEMDIPEETLSAVKASADQGTTTKKRPWKVRSAGSFAPDFSLNCDGLLPLRIEGGGQASHIGRYEVVNTWCTGGLGPGFPNFITGILTAANGDLIFFESVLFGEGFVDYVITGGTGRFEGAEGELRLFDVAFELESGPGEPPSGTFANEGEGYIVY